MRTRVKPRSVPCADEARANLFDVRAVRLCLLVVLAVLLPLRGAVAAAMLCSPTGTGLQSELRIQPVAHHAIEQEQGAAQDHHGGAHHDHAASEHPAGDQGHPSSDHCNLCSAYCSITPLVSALPTLFHPLEPPAVKFPDVASPAPTFLSDGQERPPRSI